MTELAERIGSLGLVPGIIFVIIGGMFAFYFWLPRSNGKPSRRADTPAGALLQALVVAIFLVPGIAIVAGHLL